MEDKPEICEWDDCQKKPEISVILDNEHYWFCNDDHADKFRDYIMKSGNY